MPSELATRHAEHVILIDIDAFDLSYFDSTCTPHLDELGRLGVRTVATGVFKSFSNPARSTIVTGAWPGAHDNQAYYYDETRDRAIGQERPYLPGSTDTPLRAETIAQALRTEGRTVAGVNYPNLRGYGIEPGDSQQLYAAARGDVTTRVDAAIDLLRGRWVDSDGTVYAIPGGPDLLAIYIADIDDLGHLEGPQSPTMPALVERVDDEVGRLVRAVDELGIRDRTTFVVVSDHGMVHIAKPILPDLTDRINTTGLRWDVAPEGARAAPDVEVIIVPTARNADITLRGRAASPEARAAIVELASDLGDRVIVHDTDDLAAMHACDRVGSLVVEAAPPYHLSADTARRPGGAHGGSAEMNVPLILSGAGVESAANVVAPTLADVAPTISSLLGVRTPADAQGRALDLFGADL